MWPRHILTLGSVHVIITNIGLPLALALTPKLCYSSRASNSDSTILSSSRLKARLAINMFDSQCLLDVPGRKLLYELSFTNGVKRALRVIVKYHCASARTHGLCDVHLALSNGLWTSNPSYSIM